MNSKFLLISLFLCVASLAGAQSIPEAAKSGNANEIKERVKGGEDINAVDAAGNSALAYAVISDNFSLVKKLIKYKAVADASTVIALTKSKNAKMLKLFQKQGFNVNAKNQAGDTPLIHALKEGDKEMFNFFLGNGADVNLKDQQGNTALLHAIKNNLDNEIILALIEKSDVNSKNNASETPLLIAMTQGDIPLFNHLLNNKADINVSDATGLSPFWFALEKSDIALLQRLQGLGANMGTERNGLTPVLHVLKTGNKAMFKQLVDWGANVNSDGDDGKTPLMLTLANGDTESYSYLLASKNIDINAANRFGYTLLDNAFKSSSSAVIKNLMTRGAKFGPAQERNSITPLMYAIEYKKSDLIYDLIDGKTVNKESRYGKTALILAIENGNFQLVNTLLDRGASTSRANYLGNCPVGYAVAHNKIDILQLLIRKGGNVNCINEYGSTPLIEAAYFDLPQAASILIAAGANRNHRANFGDTAYDVADRLKNMAVLRVLGR